ncbi:MAG: hypothetical protein AAGC68_10725 [Verrucomicrobiota bacterium]
MPKLLDHWQKVASPRSSDSRFEIDLVAFLASPEEEDLKYRFLSQVEKAGLKTAFRAVECRFVEIDPERDYYIREKFGMPPTQGGFVAGPNDFFFGILDQVRSDYTAVFYNEIDCVPVRSGWADAFVEEAARLPQAWVIGSEYEGWSSLPYTIDRHLNGNAIYRVGDPQFQAFVDEVWRPRLEQLSLWGYPDIAFDCLPELFSELNRGPLVPAEYRAERARMFGRMVPGPFLVNVGGTEDAAWRFNGLEGLLESYPETSIFHGAWLSDFVVQGKKEFRTAKKKRGSKAREKEVTKSNLRPSWCIKHVHANENTWLCGDQFALKGKGGVVFVDLLFRNRRVDEVELKVVSDEPVETAAKLWSERPWRSAPRRRITRPGSVSHRRGSPRLQGHRRS